MDLTLGDTELIIEAAKKKGILRNQLAYILATAYHETAHTMKPVEEAFYLKEKAAAYRKKLKYYPHHGRGYVQLTWLRNYQKAKEELGVDFVNQPNLLLLPEYATAILIEGMMEGWFTGKKLGDYVTLKKSDFLNARRVVNGTDKNDIIAAYARQYDKALKEMGYGEEETPKEPTEAGAIKLLKEIAKLIANFLGGDK